MKKLFLITILTLLGSGCMAPQFVSQGGAINWGKAAKVAVINLSQKYSFSGWLTYTREPSYDNRGGMRYETGEIVEYIDPKIARLYPGRLANGFKVNPFSRVKLVGEYLDANSVRVEKYNGPEIQVTYRDDKMWKSRETEELFDSVIWIRSAKEEKLTDSDVSKFYEVAFERVPRPESEK